MGTTANTGQSTWEQIHGGVRETERLIGQKNYNLAMVKARQTLEYMVKCLCERYGILETGLLEMIDALYSAGKISKTTCEHYHKIRTIGNKAIHEGHNSAYNANQAHHLLSQDVYTFANDYNDTKKSTRASRSAAPTPASSRLRGNSRHSSASSGNEKPAGTRSGSSEGRRPRAYAGGPSFEFRSIIKPVLLIIIIILVILAESHRSIVSVIVEPVVSVIRPVTELRLVEAALTISVPGKSATILTTTAIVRESSSVLTISVIVKSRSVRIISVTGIIVSWSVSVISVSVISVIVVSWSVGIVSVSTISVIIISRSVRIISITICKSYTVTVISVVVISWSVISLLVAKSCLIRIHTLTIVKSYKW